MSCKLNIQMTKAVASRCFMFSCMFFVSDRTQVQDSDDVMKTVPCPHKVSVTFS